MKLVYFRPYLNGEMYEPPIGIACIAAYIRTHIENVEQQVLDLDILKLDKDKVKKQLQDAKPDIVCISAFSYNRFDGFDVAKIAKELGAYVIFGGQHVTFLDKDTLEHVPWIDIIIRGEAEETIIEVLKHWREGKSLEGVKGVSFLNKVGKYTRNPDREFIDVTHLPLPAYDLFPMEQYQSYGVMASRGCPYNCNFCGSPQFWKRKLRLRDPKNVIDEIEYLIKTYGKKIVHFKDDVFTADKAWAREIMEELERRNLGVKWECLTRVNLVDKDTLALMKRTGCVLIEYGIETGNEQLMKQINKGIVKSMIVNAIKLTREAGIPYGTFFMVGHPGETRETLEETFDFAFKLRADSVAFTLTDAIPGTELYNTAIKKGYIPKDFSWAKADKRNFNGFPVPRFENSNLQEEKMKEFSRRFIMRFALGRLFDMKDSKDYYYVFQNEWTPYHFTVKNKKDIQILLQELHKGWNLASSPHQKIKGAILLPFFIGRLAKNHIVRLYRNAKIKLTANDGRIHKESQTQNLITAATEND